MDSSLSDHWWLHAHTPQNGDQDSGHGELCVSNFSTCPVTHHPNLFPSPPVLTVYIRGWSSDRAYCVRIRTRFMSKATPDLVAPRRLGTNAFKILYPAENQANSTAKHHVHDAHPPPVDFSNTASPRIQSASYAQAAAIYEQRHQPPPCVPIQVSHTPPRHFRCVVPPPSQHGPIVPGFPDKTGKGEQSPKYKKKWLKHSKCK